MNLIGLGRLINVASENGIPLSLHAIHHAMRIGALVAAEHNPPRFTTDEANRFLNALWREEQRT